MSNLINHAQRELEDVGLFDKDSDYNGALGEAVMQLIAAFSKQEHSGASASMVISLFGKLAKFENLSPLTSNPDEWEDVSDMTDKPLWQSKRRSSMFSRDGGKTWYDIDNPELNNGDVWQREAAV